MQVLDCSLHHIYWIWPPATLSDLDFERFYSLLGDICQESCFNKIPLKRSFILRANELLDCTITVRHQSGFVGCVAIFSTCYPSAGNLFALPTRIYCVSTSHCPRHQSGASVSFIPIGLEHFLVVRKSWSSDGKQASLLPCKHSRRIFCFWTNLHISFVEHGLYIYSSSARTS